MMSKIEMQEMDAVIGIHREMRKANEIDWEQRRYEIAKNALPAIMNKAPVHFTKEDIIQCAVDFADALIEELKGGSRETETSIQPQRGA